jgi:hypothetical protein
VNGDGHASISLYLDIRIYQQRGPVNRRLVDVRADVLALVDVLGGPSP